MKRLVVKIGSSTLTTADGRIDQSYLRKFAEQVARVRAVGWQVVVVSSSVVSVPLVAVAVMIAVPGARGVTTPLSLTVATLSSLDVHTTVA